MAGARPEPFQVALASLRDRLQAGAFAPGARITAIEVADQLRLSATPVREALSRLAGEGLIEDRRGQGFFVRLLSAVDIADLHRLSLAHLLIAQEPQRLGRRPAAAGARPSLDADDPAATVERLFLSWAGEAGSRVLVQGLRRVRGQLAGLRACEPLVFADLAAEAARLLQHANEGDRAARVTLIRAYHARRIRAAARLAALQGGDENSGGIV